MFAPNTSLQRTPSASPPSPLGRKPLGVGEEVSQHEHLREDRDLPSLIAFGSSKESNRPNCVGD